MNQIGNNLILSLRGKDMPMSIIIDKLDSGEAVRFSQIQNDISLNKNFFLPIIGKHQQQLITYLPSEYLLTQADKASPAEINASLKRVLEQLPLASNPVLVRMNLR